MLLPISARAADAWTGPSSPFTVEQDLAHLLQELRQEAGSILEKIRLGESVGSSEAQVLLSHQDAINADLLLLESRLSENEKRLIEKGASATIFDRQREMARQFAEKRKAITELLDSLSLWLKQGGSQAELEDILDSLIKVLDGSAVKKEQKPTGSLLPFRPMALSPRTPEPGPTSPVIAYLNPLSTAHEPEDTSETAEVQFTPEIWELLASLRYDPVAIFEYVQANITNELYYGSMKGATETLRQRSGNDLDQASLLINLYRAIGIPSRYVRGVSQFPVSKVLELTGTESTERATEAFTRAGIPHKIIRQGGKIIYYDVEHFWVEAYIPYNNYRGNRLDDYGKIWLPLDPSIKSYNIIEGLSLLNDMGIDADEFMDEYLSAPSDLTPLETYRKKITDYLSLHRPDVQYEQLLTAKEIAVTPLGILPNTLPYQTSSVNWEYTELPESLRHKVRFIALTQDSNETLFDVTLPAAELAGKRLTLSYIPATVEDHVVVNSFLGLDRTPAYLVRLRPVLKAGGVVMAAGGDGIAMGLSHELRMEIIGPGMAAETVRNELITGGYYAIGLSAQNMVYSPPANITPEDTEQIAAEILFQQAALYLERWNKSENELANLLKVSLVRPILSEAMVGNVYNSTLLFGQPQTIDWKGVFIDADLRISEPVPQSPNDETRLEFMKLSGLEGSILENRIFEDNFKVESVSAAKVIQLAHFAGIPVHRIDSINIQTILPTLSISDEIKSGIEDAVSQGQTIMIPAHNLPYYAWNGTGYIMQDNQTGAAGYMLSGSIAGGQTVEEEWAIVDYVIGGWVILDRLDHVLGSPYSKPSNKDPYAAYSVIKVGGTDRQIGIVGEQINKPIEVLVQDRDGFPVKGATVTFTVLAGGGDFGGPTTITAITDYLGVARANPKLGKTILESPHFMKLNPGDKYDSLVGKNIITANVVSPDGDIYLDSPFVLYAKPGTPDYLNKISPDTYMEPELYAGYFYVSVHDKYNNVISNKTVTFKVLDPVPRLNGPKIPTLYKNLGLFQSMTSCQVKFPEIPLLGQCNEVDTLSVVTSAEGAYVHANAGNLFAVFRIEASIQTLSIDKAVTFEITTGTGASVSSVLLSGMYYDCIVETELVGTVNVNMGLHGLIATKVDTELQCPFELYTYEVIRIEVEGETLAATRPIDVDVLNFEVIRGEGSVTQEPVHIGPIGSGRYNLRFRVGQNPGKNIIRVSATRTDVRDDGSIFTPKDDTYLVSYGVRVTLKPPNIPFDISGVTTSDVDLTYTIEPDYNAGTWYYANSASIDIFEKSGSDELSWVSVLYGSQSWDTGTAKLIMGTKFDLGKDYLAQVVLNRGTGIEIRSDMVTLLSTLRVAFENKFGEKVEGIQISDPHPVITLDNVSLADIALDYNTAIFEISGTVSDPLADIVEGGKADIEEVFIEGNGIPITSISVRKVNELTSRLRPYAFKGEFGPVMIAMPLVEGDNLVVVKATNISGNKGSDSITLKAAVNIEGFFEIPLGYTVKDLGMLKGPNSVISGINAAGLVVGESEVTDGDTHAFIWQWPGGIMTDLGTLGGTNSRAFGVNAAGQVVGESEVTDGDTHAFIWQWPGGVMTDLGTLGGTNSRATGVNAADQVVGESEIIGGGTHAFSWQNGVMMDLGTLGGSDSEAIGINNLGTVIGWAHTASGDTHAFVYFDSNGDMQVNPGEIVDLNSLIPSGSGWELLKATGINDTGIIVGVGRISGETHAFLLTPLIGSSGGQHIVSLLSVENNDSTGIGLVNPIIVNITDPSVNDTNISNEKVNVFDKDFNLKIENNQPQADRPFMAVTKPVPEGISNIKDVSSERKEMPVHYKTISEDLDFASPSVYCDPVYNRWAFRMTNYASGTTVEHRIFDTRFSDLSTADLSIPKIIGDTDDITVLSHEIKVDVCNNAPLTVLWMKLKLPKTAHLDNPVKSVNVTVHYNNGNELFKYYDSFRAVPLKAVILAIDGGGYEAVNDAIENGSAENFAKIFKGGVNLGNPVLSALPSITWANWPGVFSGQPPKDHGITGNSFLARERAGIFSLPSCQAGFQGPIVASADREICDSIDGFNLTLLGLHILSKDGAGSLYDEVRSAVNDNEYIHGLSVMTWYSKATNKPNLEVTRKTFGLHGLEWGMWEHNPNAAKALDRLVAEQAKLIFPDREEIPDITSIYFPGPDNLAHAIGGGCDSGQPVCLPVELVPSIKKHFEEITDKEFGRFLEDLDNNGWLFATVFALVADHGLIAFHNDDDHTLVLNDELELLFDYFGTVWRGWLHPDMTNIIYSPNGGMAQIYVKGGFSWKDPPDQQDVDNLALAILEQADLQPVPRAPGLGRQIVDDLKGALGDPPAIFVRTDGSSADFNNDYMWLSGWDIDKQKPVYKTLAEFVIARGVKDRWPEFEERIKELNDKKDGRSGDILLIMDVEHGYMTVNRHDAFNGWHGGPTSVEGEVPLIFNMMLDDKTFINQALDEAIIENGGKLRNWLLTPVIRNIFKSIRYY